MQCSAVEIWFHVIYVDVTLTQNIKLSFKQPRTNANMNLQDVPEIHRRPTRNLQQANDLLPDRRDQRTPAEVPNVDGLKQILMLWLISL